MKKMMCSLFFRHRQVIYETKDVSGGKDFQYIKRCRCGERVTKSVPLNDNDLLANIHISHREFPVLKAL